MSTFSERLREAMTERRKKQIDLVRETGISKSMISDYVNGKFEPKQNNLYLLSKALNVKEGWLMGYDGISMNKFEIDYKNRFKDTAVGDEGLKNAAEIIAFEAVREEKVFVDLYYQVLAGLDFINEDGFEKVIDYIYNISLNPRYSLRDDILQNDK